MCLQGTVSDDERAISPVLVVLLMVAIAVAGSLVTFTWVMGYMGTTATRTGHVIQIQSVAFDKPASGDVTVYVQNVGQGSVEITNVYIEGHMQSITAPDPLPEGQTISIAMTPTHVLGDTVKVKVTCIDGTSAEA